MTAQEDVDLALAAFAAFAKVIDAVRSAKSGAISPQVALDAINAMIASDRSGDAAADAADLAKFPNG